MVLILIFLPFFMPPSYNLFMQAVPACLALLHAHVHQHMMTMITCTVATIVKGQLHKEIDDALEDLLPVIWIRLDLCRRQQSSSPSHPRTAREAWPSCFQASPECKCIRRESLVYDHDIIDNQLCI